MSCTLSKRHVARVGILLLGVTEGLVTLIVSGDRASLSWHTVTRAGGRDATTATTLLVTGWWELRARVAVAVREWVHGP